jgi:heterodisulfide reductase subunit A-like polyferredoxin
LKKPKFIPGFADIPAKRAKMPELGLEERRLNFKEVELGFTEELARQEAARCLSCRRCIGCGLCLAECDQCAIVYDEEAGEVSIEADAVVFAPEAEVFPAGRKPELGYGACSNVITSFEFERLASADGPFGGLVVRPFDGEIPRRVAFIQCVGSRDESIGANYCSVECCSRTILQARRTRELIGAAEVRIFHRGLRPTGKTSELDLESLLSEKWVSLKEAVVSAVKEDAATGAVTVTYGANGKTAEDAFDLVVLAAGLRSRRDFRRYSRAGGAAVNKYGFVDPGVANMIGLKAGIAFAGTILGPQAASRSIGDALGAAARALASGCSPAAGASGASAASGPKTAGVGGKQPLVLGCEYGLSLAGTERPAIAGLKTYPLLCYRDGRQAMREGMDQATGLVVVGCHSAGHEDLFARLLDLPAERVRIIGASDLARDGEGAVAAAVEALSGQPRVAAPAGGVKRPGAVAILGGGVAGLGAAAQLLRRGIKTVIIEASESIGSNLARVPHGRPEDAKTVEDFLKAIETNPGTRLIRSARLESVERSDGSLKVSVSAAGGKEAFEVGALVVATGAKSYVPRDPAPGGRIMTQENLVSELATRAPAWRKLVMVQCVGARDADHPYCSRYCCRLALANAVALRQANPASEVTILHKGIRVFGPEEELYADALERGIEFVEMKDKPAVRPGERPRVTGASADGKVYDLECDAVVLSVGYGPGAAAAGIADVTGAPLDSLGFFETPNHLVRPFATSAPGIFVCGFARAPVTVEEAFGDGQGAAGAVCRYLNGG